MQTDQGMSRYVLRDGDCYWVKPQDVRPTDIDCTDMEATEFMAFFFNHRKARTGLRNTSALLHGHSKAA